MAAHNREAKIKLAALHPRVAEVLRITNLEMLFDIHKSEGEAVDAFLREQQPAEMRLQSSERDSWTELANDADGKTEN